MAIPETQLETWAGQGAVAGSRDTYNFIKSVLESDGSPYADREFEVYLQGSYGNDTNVYAESDVDIIIQLTSAFQYSLDALPVEQKSLFQQAFTGGVTYGLTDFKREVLAHLNNRFPGEVTDGEKAILIDAYGNRRKADVIVCMGFRNYSYFYDYEIQDYTKGIWFKSSNGVRIANYPKLHSENLTVRHQASNQWLKPTIRIFKNMRRKMIAEGLIQSGDAPSYFIEGMLYNVPLDHFGGSYADTVRNCLVWLNAANRVSLKTANEQYPLLGNSPVTWPAEKYNAFIAAAIQLWNGW